MRRRFLITTNLFTQQPKNQIWYTSTNNDVVTPYQIHLFGANIVSNTYSGGKGIIKFDGDITEIGMRAFQECDNLTSVTIPNSVTKIGESAFYYCKSLASVTIPNSVTKIGKWSFQECSNLNSVTIPNSVTTIGGWAFWGCTNLTSVYCKATTPPALDGNFVFNNNGSGRKIYVPTGSVDAYKNATNWSKYADAIVGYDF